RLALSSVATNHDPHRPHLLSHHRLDLITDGCWTTTLASALLFCNPIPSPCVHLNAPQTSRPPCPHRQPGSRGRHQGEAPEKHARSVCQPAGLFSPTLNFNPRSLAGCLGYWASKRKLLAPINRVGINSGCHQHSLLAAGCCCSTHLKAIAGPYKGNRHWRFFFSPLFFLCCLQGSPCALAGQDFCAHNTKKGKRCLMDGKLTYSP
ncbi:MAG: hypothetical protein J3Q66DRAFT_121529, partial [Benniella sp.]